MIKEINRSILLLKKISQMPSYAIWMRCAGVVYARIDRLLIISNRFSDRLLLRNKFTLRNLKDLKADLLVLKHPCVIRSSQLTDEHQKLKCKIVASAEKIMLGGYSVLGVEIDFSDRVEWHRDFKSGRIWPKEFFSDLYTLDLDQNSDVKVPWEVSRLQWIIPVAQAWLLTDDEKYALYIKRILNDWIRENPYAIGINWACTMEPAMRVHVWTWLYHVLSGSQSWQDNQFNQEFLSMLYEHVKFVYRYIEITDINGNHLLANCSALVVGGVFFNHGTLPRKWKRTGLNLLEKEIKKQVYTDGVDYEASIAYHRFVTELLFFPAVYAELNGDEISNEYKELTLKMVNYIKCYTRPDGMAPNIGDADDGRVLPLGDQPINDHRYLYNLVHAIWGDQDLCQGTFDDCGSEILWWNCSVSQSPMNCGGSSAFKVSGNFILREKGDYVFVDCGPVGLMGRGGHGHNDCLSYEALLCGHALIADAGCYTYTSSYKARNYYRSTAAHNTPVISGHEINRFITEKNIWNLYADAEPELISWHDAENFTLFRGKHSGYMRLKPAIQPVRTVVLDKIKHSIMVHDDFVPHCGHEVEVPVHLAPEVTVNLMKNQYLILASGIERFVLEWKVHDYWSYNKSVYEYSPSYGVKMEAARLSWRSLEGCRFPLTICLYPGSELKAGFFDDMFEKYLGTNELH